MMAGTPVLILGDYPFGSPPAWLSLDALATPLTLPAALARLRRPGLADASFRKGGGR